MTERIRWEDEDGSREFAVMTGHIGTIDIPLFKIYEPDERGGGHAEDWLLTCSLPAQDRTRYGDDPDELKAEAERWLEEFISPLGAIFPEQYAGHSENEGSGTGVQIQPQCAPVPPHPEEEG